ncbi:MULTISPECIES: nuclear transport factor 2 family protein [Sphingomonas]|mgnify:CR=1 FL=1|uniref:Ketosteroid isomerase-like protein n=1 Tax=Sphingomonas leidyi TaxID=68569 RepID=A0A7X5ZVD8_9SPHN|nr:MULTISPECIES: nuclear transport factor 2 family protein [Sphingomonas]NIJ65006.1 ketosteroid isomerase-like protein [Sphingomonas leidyi]OJY47468.1 MAG: hypothetical protein BGP17_09745 [Sphingomonas sp. 67-41]
MIRIAIAAALLTAAPSAQPPYGQAAAKRDVRAVIETFRTAIIRRDKAAFLALFHGPVIWQGVDSDALAARSKRTPGVDMKAAFDPGKTPASFIEDIANEKDGSEERFDNVAIDTDGDIASVTFDFVYLLGGRPINAGKEAWHLVRTERGWKIVSVIYSNHDPV